MADKNWRTNPNIMAARSLQQELDVDAVVVLAIRGDSFYVVSYGRNGRLCNDASNIADLLFQAVEDGSIPVDLS